MKALVAIMTVLAATVAFAKTDIQAMSWAEILSDSSLTTYNSLQFQNGPGLGVTFKRPTDRGVCHDGSYIYGGKTKVEVCSGSDNDSDCEWVSVKLKTPFEYSVKVQECKGSDGDSDCSIVTKVVKQYPNQKVAVYKKAQSDEGSDSFLGNKAYTIPYCADLKPVPAN